MKKFILTLLLVSLTAGATAQTENPRGIYRLMTLVGKNGEVPSEIVIACLVKWRVCQVLSQMDAL